MSNEELYNDDRMKPKESVIYEPTLLFRSDSNPTINDTAKYVINDPMHNCKNIFLLLSSLVSSGADLMENINVVAESKDIETKSKNGI